MGWSQLLAAAFFFFRYFCMYFRMYSFLEFVIVFPVLLRFSDASLMLSAWVPICKCSGFVHDLLSH